MRSTAVQRFLFLLQSSIDSVIYMVSSDCVAFSFVLCFPHCIHKLLFVSQLQEKNVKPSKQAQKKTPTLTSSTLNNTFLLKEIQSLNVFCLHSFLKTTSAGVLLCRNTLRKHFLLIHHQINLSLWNQSMLFVLSGCCRGNGCTE